MTALGFEPFAPSLEESSARIREESAKRANVIRAPGTRTG
jgi:hypothetical protein